MADFTALKTAIQNAIKQNGNEEITGNLLQEILLAIVTTLGDGNINELITALETEATTRSQADTTLQQNIDAEATTRGNADTTLQQHIDAEALARGNADTALQQNIDAEAQARSQADTALGGRIDGVIESINAINAAIRNGYVYAGIATPSSTPASGKVFYLALTAGTYTNFGNTAVAQGINILKYNGSTWSLDSFVGIDDAPAPSSQKLVKSGGVFDEVMKNGSAFDLSAYNGGATYADLNAALTALNALPAAYKRGGMSMKFVLSSDNKYRQYRFLLSGSFTAAQFANVDNWQGVDDEPTPNSTNLVTSGGVFDEFNSIIPRIGGFYCKTTSSTNLNMFTDLNIKAGDTIKFKVYCAYTYTYLIVFANNGNLRIKDSNIENLVIYEYTTAVDIESFGLYFLSNATGANASLMLEQYGDIGNLNNLNEFAASKDLVESINQLTKNAQDNIIKIKPLEKKYVGTIRYQDGVIAPTGGYLSEKFPVIAGQTVFSYIVSSGQWAAFYNYTLFDVNGEQISTGENTKYVNYEQNRIMTIPLTVYDVEPCYIQFNLFDGVDIYVQFLNNEEIGSTAPMVSYDTIIGNTYKQVEPFTRTYNLFDKNNFLRGYITPSGNYENTPLGATSAAIAIKPNTTYRVRGILGNNCYYVIYNTDGTKQWGTLVVGGVGSLITSPNNAYCLIVTLALSVVWDEHSFDDIIIYDATDGEKDYIPYWKSPSFIDKSDVKKIVKESQDAFWNGKKVIFCGTSITSDPPIQQSPSISWATHTANLLGMSYINYAMSASYVRYDRARGFSATIQEKQEAGVTGGVVSYETALIANANYADLFVIEYGYNDSHVLGDASVINHISAEYRDTFIEAMNYILDQLYKVNPFARVVIVGFWNPYSEQGNRVKVAQELLCNRWHIPFINIADEIGATTDIIGSEFVLPSGIYTSLTPISRIELMTWRGGTDYDGVHPYLPEAEELIGRIVAQKLKALY